MHLHYCLIGALLFDIVKLIFQLFLVLLLIIFFFHLIILLFAFETAYFYNHHDSIIYESLPTGEVSKVKPTRTSNLKICSDIDIVTQEGLSSAKDILPESFIIDYEKSKVTTKGYFDTKTGELVIDCNYDEVLEFSEGYAAVKEEKKAGIIDEEGNPTGKILPREDIHNQNYLHNEVACFVINDNNEVLLEKRSPTKRYSPNKYGLCAGHVMAFEPLKSALVREIKEEIGITVSENDLIPFGEKEYIREETNSHITYFFYIKLNLDISEFTIQKEELTEVKWFKIEDIINLVKQDNNPTVITNERLYLLDILKTI